MVEVSISEISKHPKILDELDEIAKVVNKKDKKIRGVFIPASMMSDELERYIKAIERQRKRELLKRIAKAQREDRIGDGTVGDGL